MIEQFRGSNYFLSNFYDSAVYFEGLWYLNNESAFQSAKLNDVEKRKQFCQLSPNEAKRLGRRVKLRSDWEQIKDSVMESIIRSKFMVNESLQQKLIATKDECLIEGNEWHDNYWGNCNCPRCQSHNGLNMLGRILMKIRDEINSNNRTNHKIYPNV
jgi:hypothetical protein